MNFRYEKKFLVPKASYSAMQKYIRTSNHEFRLAYPEREVFSIYYDTITHNFYHSNVDGNASRIKVRARKYPKQPEDLSNFNLELKCKHGEVGFKKTCQINLDSSLKLNREDLESLITQDIDVVLYKNLLGLLIPTVSILYTREYYISHSQKIRLTVDRNLKYGSPYNHISNLSALSDLSNTYVVELKYDVNNKINPSENYFPFRLERNSKYVKTLSALYGKTQ